VTKTFTLVLSFAVVSLFALVAGSGQASACNRGAGQAQVREHLSRLPGQAHARGKIQSRDSNESRHVELAQQISPASEEDSVQSAQAQAERIRFRVRGRK
jgi:hypothetical protein